MAGPDLYRLVAVFAGTSLGTGYLIGETLVLTAWHVVANSQQAGEGIEVVFPEPHPEAPVEGRLRAIVAWRDEGLDACLLRLDDPAWTLPRPAPRRWWWGTVDGTAALVVRALGFPAVARRAGKAVRHMVIGTVTPATGGQGPMFALNVTNGTPKDTDGESSPWAGMSGAAVFAGPYLVAVLVRDPEGWGNDRLDALKVSKLLVAPGFGETCRGDGMATGEERVIATAGGVAVPTAVSDFEHGLSAELKTINDDLLYLRLARILGFGDDSVPDAQSAPIFAKEIVANAGSVIDEVYDAVYVVSDSQANELYKWVAPWGWVPETASRQLREKVTAPDRPVMVAVSARRESTVHAVIQHAGGLFKKYPPRWRLRAFQWPEGEQPPAAVVEALKKTVKDALGRYLLATTTTRTTRTTSPRPHACGGWPATSCCSSQARRSMPR